jgi:glycosyltransferase involved in cell wall biosynthesis
VRRLVIRAPYWAARSGLFRPAASYVLVTPVHDERELLSDLAATIRAQELRPVRWVIVDDGSKDGTADELARLAHRDPWIHVVTLARTGDADAPSRYAEVLAHGFVAAAELLEADALTVEYLANLDADVRCPPQLFAELLQRCERDRMIGFASCTLTETAEDGERVAAFAHPCGAPRAAVRLWRRQCIEEIGMQPTPHWASVTSLRARNRGWKTVVHEDLVAEVVRAYSWRGWRAIGDAVWFVGAHPLLVAAHAVIASARRRDLRGVALLAGYLGSALRQRPRTGDPELLEFYGTDLPRRQLEDALAKLPWRRS